METNSKTGIGYGLVPVCNISVKEIAPNSAAFVQFHIERLVKVIIEICHDCLVKRRNDGALIFVPPERSGSATNKNLITIWAGKSTFRIRIMPDPTERFIPGKMSVYKSNLNNLYSKLIEERR